VSYEESYRGHPSLYDALRRVGQEETPEGYLEIGVREGDSLRALLEVWVPGLIVLCDTWGADYGGSDRGGHEHIEKLLEDLKCFANVIYLDGRSQEVLPGACADEVFDLVLVDGDHSLQGAMADYQNCWPLLKPGGIMLADDTHHPAHLYLDDAFRHFVATHDGEVLWEMKDEASGICCARKRYVPSKQFAPGLS
jgi:hypothetical protein